MGSRKLKRCISVLLCLVLLCACARHRGVLETGSWGLSFPTQGEAPVGNADKDALMQYDAAYLGDTSEKVIYLTFDAGYENGCTGRILDALKKHGFDAAFGGARRDEEVSRAKERIFSFRNAQQQWEPKNQRPELWNIYNTRIRKGESIRVFPLSNWTELDIWQYIRQEAIPVVPLYFAAKRSVVSIDGNLILVDDMRMPKHLRERAEVRKVRFRTLGCYPLTGAIESSADTIEAIVEEMMAATKSERTTRVIDFDREASMEQKKREGYF